MDLPGNFGLLEVPASPVKTEDPPQPPPQKRSRVGLVAAAADRHDATSPTSRDPSPRPEPAAGAAPSSPVHDAAAAKDTKQDRCCDAAAASVAVAAKAIPKMIALLLPPHPLLPLLPLLVRQLVQLPLAVITTAWYASVAFATVSACGTPPSLLLTLSWVLMALLLAPTAAAAVVLTHHLRRKDGRGAHPAAATTAAGTPMVDQEQVRNSLAAAAVTTLPAAAATATATTAAAVAGCTGQAARPPSPAPVAMPASPYDITVANETLSGSFPVGASSTSTSPAAARTLLIASPGRSAAAPPPRSPPGPTGRWRGAVDLLALPSPLRSRSSLSPTSPLSAPLLAAGRSREAFTAEAALSLSPFTAEAPSPWPSPPPRRLISDSSVVARPRRNPLQLELALTAPLSAQPTLQGTSSSSLSSSSCTVPQSENTAAAGGGTHVGRPSVLYTPRRRHCLMCFHVDFPTAGAAATSAATAAAIAAATAFATGLTAAAAANGGDPASRVAPAVRSQHPHPSSA